ncbi:Sorting nexin-32-like protein [Leptotrombidium deliense]|uniref:Sorting nexin-32-like protein n=1 Tax=Leptotrombidium deliense TaxID=299467 RepID=A0A443SF87_9ACAR|nr:Sorting nexin-32-like protein [Leptotrombidium deliense]
MEDSTKVNHFVPSDEDDDEFQSIDQNTKGKGSLDSLSTISCLSSSSSSTFAPREPFKAQYYVKIFSNAVTKDGEAVTYTIISKSLFDCRSGEVSVKRQYEDFEYLNHCLVTSNYPNLGLLTPPLPPQPAITLSMAREKSKEKLGSSTKTIISDEWHKDCWHLQEYLRLMLNHPIYGKHDIWQIFLRSQDPPLRVKIKKSVGLMDRINDSIEKSKSGHKDCDEFFHRERNWVLIYSNAIKAASDTFNSIIYGRLKLCGVLAHLSTALNINLTDNESSVNRIGVKFSNLFSLALDDYRKGVEIINLNDEASLGCCLELWSRYVDVERDMLNRRTSLLIDYENANRNLDKAKPNKKETLFREAYL